MKVEIEKTYNTASDSTVHIANIGRVVLKTSKSLGRLRTCCDTVSPHALDGPSRLGAALVRIPQNVL